MATLKYVRTENGKIVAFPMHHSHSDYKTLRPISAGFIEVNRGAKGTLVWKCYGYSISLDLPSKQEDTFILHNQIGYENLCKSYF
ncbi:hypothetical protein [Luteibaculum oceani]|uniref:Uncharacterized protein n=1 Tax=Luteibaculum oceani TaxID=1294296 RepID=A0A5C6V8H2_9FLAO|nr:hypothetical protein [Luteibaculum oceani]TXC81329.1 hypothetical protein FRX97_04820 [Luteibaculum oceani]